MGREPGKSDQKQIANILLLNCVNFYKSLYYFHKFKSTTLLKADDQTIKNMQVKNNIYLQGIDQA